MKTETSKPLVDNDEFTAMQEFVKERGLVANWVVPFGSPVFSLRRINTNQSVALGLNTIGECYAFAMGYAAGKIEVYKDIHNLLD